MKKLMLIMLVCVAVLFGGVFALKAFIYEKTKSAVSQYEHPTITISATQAKTAVWQSHIKVVGSTRTVKGVDITTQLAGMITDILFKPGSDVKKGQVLVKLNIAPDVAKLHELEAKVQFAKITYKRDKIQNAFGAISQEKLDEDDSQYKGTTAEVEEQQATIDKKIIRAPFTGRLGISAVNPGEYVDTGTKVVNIQTLDPIYDDFYLPQQEAADVYVGEEVKINVDRAPKTTFTGKITTINPIVNKEVRNVEVEATLSNPKKILLPGMFNNVEVKRGNPQTYITLPELAVTFNPYGEIVYLLKKTKKTYNKKPVWIANQQFVTTGDTRGNQVAVLKGIKIGDMVVTSGQLKLKNGSPVVINNTVVPSDNPNPTVKEK